MNQRDDKLPPFSAIMQPLSRARLGKASRARNNSGMAKRFAERDVEPTPTVLDELTMCRQQVSCFCHSALEEGLLSNSLIAAERDPETRNRLLHYANNIAGWLEYADRLAMSR